MDCPTPNIYHIYKYLFIQKIPNGSNKKPIYVIHPLPSLPFHPPGTSPSFATYGHPPRGKHHQGTVRSTSNSERRNCKASSSTVSITFKATWVRRGCRGDPGGIRNRWGQTPGRVRGEGTVCVSRVGRWFLFNCREFFNVNAGQNMYYIWNMFD